jgi:hypothetical protein
MTLRNPVGIFVALGLLLLFAACSDQKKIVGTWKTDEVVSNGMVINETDTYSADGKLTLTGSIRKGDKLTEFSGNGTWELKNSILTRTILTSTIPELIPNGTTSVQTIVSVTDQSLTMRNSEGKTTVDKRVP